MHIGVLGTGQVGRALAGRMAADGHQVTLGSRSADNPAVATWVEGAGELVDHGTFATAASAGELLVNATPGVVSLEVLASVEPADLVGKVLLDVANPLDHGQGFPPTLSFCNTTSLGEQIQAAHPRLRVVKALNTMHHELMVDPARLSGAHHLFMCGDDADAKDSVTELVTAWGWPPDAVVDLGDITNARGTEMLLPLWVRLYGTLGTGDFNLAVVR